MINPAELQKRLAGVFRNIFRPSDRRKIVEWAPDNIVLSSEESGDFPGNYDPDLNPVPTVLFDVAQSGFEQPGPRWKKAVFKKSSQSGVTLVFLVLMCWWVCNVCRNILYVIDSREEARDISSIRFQPMIRACKAARRLGRIISEEMTNMACQFAGCVAYFRGCNSIGGLSNKSISLVGYDEADAFKKKMSAKERATALGGERTKRQTRFLEVLLSKPQEWEDITNQEYLSGSRHKCFVPCPHCGEFQGVEWERIKFGHLQRDNGTWRFEDFSKGVYLECVNASCCGPLSAPGAFGRRYSRPRQIHEEFKPWMFKRREWRQTNFPGDPDNENPPIDGVFSCEITDLHSLLPKEELTWWGIAKEFVELNAKKDFEGLETFFRGRLARPTKRKRIVVETDSLREMCGKYGRGHCPFEPDAVFMASDVQQVPPVKKWIKIGFRLKDDAAAVIDYGEFLSFEDLIREADRPVIVDKWNRFTPIDKRVNPITRCGLVDERFDRDNVRDFIVKTYVGRNEQGVPQYRFYSSRGWGGLHGRRLRTRDIVTPVAGAGPNASHDGFPLWVYDLDVDTFKERVYNKRFAGFPRLKAALEALAEGKRVKLPRDVPPTFLPAVVDPEFLDELSAEEFWQNPEKGNRWEWKEEPNGPNDWGDAFVYCEAEWYFWKPIIALELAGNLDLAA